MTPNSRAASKPEPATFPYTPTSGQRDMVEETGGNPVKPKGKAARRSGRCCTDKQNIPECENLNRAARGHTPRAYLRVYGFMLLQAHRVPEGLAAHFARKGSRAAVGPAHVHLEPVRRGEHLRRVGPGRRPLRGAKGRGPGARARARGRRSQARGSLTLLHLMHL